MSYLLSAVLGLVLVVATVVGIVSANQGGHRPSAGVQNNSGVVLYGGR